MLLPRLHYKVPIVLFSSPAIAAGDGINKQSFFKCDKSNYS